jgi:hypothetical protein
MDFHDISWTQIYQLLNMNGLYGCGIAPWRARNRQQRVR